MPLLRLTQYTADQPDHYRVEVTLEGLGARRAHTTTFEFKLAEHEPEDVRWYLETYLQYPFEPNPQRAARIEQRLEEMGAELFGKVFAGEAYKLWLKLSDELSATRIEVVVNDLAQAAAIPWELLRDPEGGAPLALRAQAFVRGHGSPVNSALTPGAAAHVRILLVICRPQLKDDVPFRSVAAQILKGLTAEARETFQLDVLRPPTFARLKQVVDEAFKAGQPYHIVHFDGHGMYAEPEGSASDWLRRLSPLMLSGPRTGKHGYLLFENPDDKDNLQLVDGPTLGRALRDAGVPVLVLNACRSAHADDSPPLSRESEATATARQRGPGVGADPHAVTRAFGSLRRR